jgi:putative phage-type endonuclease
MKTEIYEIINNLNIDIDNLDYSDINLITNQVFNALYQVNNNIEYSVVYSNVINIIDKINKDTIQDEIVAKFDKFRHQIDLLKQVKNENIKNIEIVENMEKQILFEKVKHIKSLFQPAQRQPEWYAMRETLFTASTDIYDILFGNPNKVILKKCGQGNAFTGNRYTWHGNKYEDIAIGIYESRYQRKVWEFGLIRHPKITVLGASPDGITTCGRMVEIKCPSGRKINGHIKPVYFCQMQTQLEVCDLDVCDFFECNIIEYNSYDDYKKDVYDPDFVDYLDIIPPRLNNGFIKLPNDRRTEHGLEKGMIGSYGNHPGNMTHIYPPFSLSSDEQYKWLLNKQTEMKKDGINLIIDFWYLETSSLNIVNRDKEWWEKHNVTQKLYNTWGKIEDARKIENGTDKYLSTSAYNKKYNIDQGITVDLTDLWEEEKFDLLKKQKHIEKSNEITELSKYLLDNSDDDFTIVEPKKNKIKKKIKVTKKVKKTKIVKKIKIKKKSNKDIESTIDEDVMEMIGTLQIDYDSD